MSEAEEVDAFNEVTTLTDQQDTRYFRNGVCIGLISLTETYVHVSHDKWFIHHIVAWLMSWLEMENASILLLNAKPATRNQHWQIVTLLLSARKRTCHDLKSTK